MRVRKMAMAAPLLTTLRVMIPDLPGRARALVSGLRTRLVLVALVAVIPVLGLIALGQLSVRRQIHDRAVGDGLRLIRVAAAQQASWFDGAHRLLQTLARFPTLRTE